MQKPTLLSKVQLDSRDLLKQIEELKKQNESLKKQIQDLQTPTESPEELVCLEQISVLKGKSSELELTLEESKKLETYVKVLHSIRLRAKKPKDEAADLEIDQLLETIS